MRLEAASSASIKDEAGDEVSIIIIFLVLQFNTDKYEAGSCHPLQFDQLTSAPGLLHQAGREVKKLSTKHYKLPAYKNTSMSILAGFTSFCVLVKF
jgi:hypothetical protein